MPPLKQPATLEKLTLEAVGKYVKTLGTTVYKTICIKVSDPPQRVQEETFKIKKLNLESLSTMLYGNIPHVLWFDVTTSVLSAINKLIYIADCSIDGFRSTGHQRCKNFIEELIVTLIAPYVTHLDFADHAAFTRILLAKNLDKMQHIKVLNIISMESEDVREHLAFLTSLTSFTMEYNCDDEIIHVLAHNCKKLQNLNVSGSLGVTDRSVKNIMKLQNLQHLQLSRTKISVIGLRSILSPNEVIGDAWKGIHYNLQALGYDQEYPEQLHLIACHFFKLTCISLRMTSCSDLKILSQMKNLKEFKVICGNFLMDNMGGLLEVVGHQLKILHIINVTAVDLGVIAAHCVNLSILTLCFYSVATVPHSPRLLVNSDKDLPFHRLEHLTLHGDIEVLRFILVRCLAIRSLKISGMGGVDDNFISSCLTRNPLKHLEIFRVNFGIRISLQTVRFLLKNCPNLRVVGGLGISVNVRLFERSLLIESLKRKNYDFNII